jgi:Glycosyl transferase family 2
MKPDLGMIDNGCNASGERTITFVITSCGRFDLLNVCLTSFLTYNTAPIARYLLIEDSGNQNIHSVIEKFRVPIEVIVNDPPLGQIAAIDRACRSIATPYIFHCEDDWRFYRSGFVEESLELLQSDPAITAVICRRPGQNRLTDLIFEKCPVQETNLIRYRKPNPWLHPLALGYSFNPGLRRLSDYQQLGSFAKWGHEVGASRYFKLRGRTIAVLAYPACETLGEERRLPKQYPNRTFRTLRQSVHARLRYRLVVLLDYIFEFFQKLAR